MVIKLSICSVHYRLSILGGSPTLPLCKRLGKMSIHLLYSLFVLWLGASLLRSTDSLPVTRLQRRLGALKASNAMVLTALQTEDGLTDVGQRQVRRHRRFLPNVMPDRHPTSSRRQSHHKHHFKVHRRCLMICGCPPDRSQCIAELSMVSPRKRKRFIACILRVCFW